MNPAFSFFSVEFILSFIRLKLFPLKTSAMHFLSFLVLFDDNKQLDGGIFVFILNGTY